MRLGDLDALKEEINREVRENRVGVFVAKRFFDIIDNAPTVEAIPQGEWIFNTSFWSCSVCKESVKTIGYCGDKKFMNEFFRFCPNCGASMKPKTCTNCETFGQDCGDCEVGDDD